MIFLGLDTGSEKSSIVAYVIEQPGPRLLALPENSGSVVWVREQIPNDELIDAMVDLVASAPGRLGIEVSTARGAPMYSQHVANFRWQGRFFQRWVDLGGEAEEVPVELARHHLTGKRAPKDPQIRAALLDAHGKTTRDAMGTRARPGPLYGVKGHSWDALAVAWFLATRAA